MVEVNAYVLENGMLYNEVNRLIYDKYIYLLLANENNLSDICIRKLKKKDDSVYISKLDSDEFETILDKFIEKNKDLLSGN